MSNFQRATHPNMGKFTNNQTSWQYWECNWGRSNGLQWEISCQISNDGGIDLEFIGIFHGNFTIMETGNLS